MSDTLEDIEKRAEKRREARAAAEREQIIVDMLAREHLEESGEVIAELKVARFVTGQPTRAFVRIPTPAQYKRFKDQVGRAVEKKNVGSQVEAGDLLAKACWVYPAPDADGRMSDAQKAMLEAFPGILSTMGLVASALAEGKSVEEGKG